jgi:hypothetical protein
MRTQLRRLKLEEPGAAPLDGAAPGSLTTLR